MSKRLYSYKRVKYWYAYDLEEICALYADKGLHIQTVRRWIKDGLKTIDKGKPTLIYGHDLITYLKKNNAKNKTQTAFDEIYCMKCQDARKPFQRKITITQKTKILHAQAACNTCKSRMFKSYALGDIVALRENFTLGDVSKLYDCVASPDKTHLRAQGKTPASELCQGELFA